MNSNDKISLSTFPSTKSEALTIIFLQNQDLSTFSPEELVLEYNKVYKIIKNTFNEELKKPQSR